ncbi:MAG: ATP-binding protein [Pseudomonadota bacterium]
MSVTQSFDPSIPVAEAKSETDELIYRISHDLRASVRALQELPAWIIEDLDAASISVPAQTGRHLELIADHACRLDLMLTGLLEYSRVGRMQPIAPVRPIDVLNSVVEDLGLPEDCVLSISVDKGSVQMGDADLARIYSILLINAVRFNTASPQRIDISGGPISDRKWSIVVTDNGTGIPEQKRDFVLRPMTKLVSRDVDPGAGMGLAILRKIAWCYGGNVKIEDAKTGSGTSVRVTLAVN